MFDKRTAPQEHGGHPQQEHQTGDAGEAVSVQPGLPLPAELPSAAGQARHRASRTVIFVNGCFWHGHEGCRYFVMPKSNVAFWQTKIERNRARDKRVQHELAAMGWHCITLWECQLKKGVREQTLESLAFTLNHIFLQDRTVKPYGCPEEQLPMAAEEQSAMAAEERPTN